MQEVTHDTRQAMQNNVCFSLAAVVLIIPGTPHRETGLQIHCREQNADATLLHSQAEKVQEVQDAQGQADRMQQSAFMRQTDAQAAHNATTGRPGARYTPRYMMENKPLFVDPTHHFDSHQK